MQAAAHPAAAEAAEGKAAVAAEGKAAVAAEEKTVAGGGTAVSAVAAAAADGTDVSSPTAPNASSSTAAAAAAAAAAPVATSAAAPAGLTPLPAVQRLSRRVIAVLGNNPGPFTLQGSNVYLVGTGAGRLLVDASDGNAGFLATLARVLARCGSGTHVAAVLVTHGHADHAGGVGGVVAAAAAAGHPPPRVYAHGAATVPAGVDVTPVGDGAVLRVAGATLRIIATPGHTPDSLSALLVEERALFVGDCVLGEGSCSFGHLRSYTASLRRLADEVPNRLYCGHGPTIGALPADADDDDTPDSSSDADALHGAAVVVTTETARGRLELYLAHRRDREAAVVAALQRAGAGGASPTALVRAIYPPTLAAPLVEAAAAVLALTCQALEEDGVVARLPLDTPPEGGSVRGVPASVFHATYHARAPPAV